MKKRILSFISVLLLNCSYAQELVIKDGWQLLGATEDINVSELNASCIDYVWSYGSSGWKLYNVNGSVTIPDSIETMTSITAGKGFWVDGNSECNVSTNNQAAESLKQIIDFGDIEIGVNQSNEFSVTLPINTDIIDLILFNTLSIDTQDLNLTDGNIDFKITMLNSSGEKLELSLPYNKNGSNIELNSSVDIDIISSSGMSGHAIPLKSVINDNNKLNFIPKYFLDYTDSDSFYAQLVKSSYEFFFSTDGLAYDMSIQLNDINISGHISLED